MILVLKTVGTFLTKSVTHTIKTWMYFFLIKIKVISSFDLNYSKLTWIRLEVQQEIRRKIQYWKHYVRTMELTFYYDDRQNNNI